MQWGSDVFNTKTDKKKKSTRVKLLGGSVALMYASNQRTWKELGVPESVSLERAIPFLAMYCWSAVSGDGDSLITLSALSWHSVTASEITETLKTVASYRSPGSDCGRSGNFSDEQLINVYFHKYFTDNYKINGNSLVYYVCKQFTCNHRISTMITV